MNRLRYISGRPRKIDRQFFNFEHIIILILKYVPYFTVRIKSSVLLLLLYVTFLYLKTCFSPIVKLMK